MSRLINGNIISPSVEAHVSDTAIIQENVDVLVTDDMRAEQVKNDLNDDKQSINGDKSLQTVRNSQHQSLQRKSRDSKNTNIASSGSSAMRLFYNVTIRLHRFTRNQIFGNSTFNNTKNYKHFGDLPLREAVNIIYNDKDLNSWNKIAAMIDYTYPSRNELKIATLNSKQQQELNYCVKHAAYAYFMEFIGDPINLKIIKKDLSLNGKRPLKMYKPGYFLAVDDVNKYILLCIRGTINIGDVLTDLDAHVTLKDFGYGRDDTKYNCHHGMYDSAALIYDDITFQIQELSKKQEYKDYKILCTGHSLGAGVCSLLGLLWNTRNTFSARKFSCYSFASPLIIGDKGMKQSQSYGNMVSVAVSTDIVTRLSIEGLIKTYCRIGELEKEGILIQSIIRKRRSCEDMDEFRQRLNNEERHLLNRVKNVDQENDIRDDIKLYPCGKVLWFVPEFVVYDDVKESSKYEKLLQMVEWQDGTPHLVQFMQFIYKIMCDFYVINANEVLAENIGLGFDQMVFNGLESFHAHFPGRYLNGFNLDIFDIFAMSKTHGFINNTLPLPMMLKRIIISIIIMSIYFIRIIYGLLFTL